MDSLHPNPPVSTNTHSSHRRVRVPANHFRLVRPPGGRIDSHDTSSPPLEPHHNQPQSASNNLDNPSPEQNENSQPSLDEQEGTSTQDFPSSQRPSDHPSRSQIPLFNRLSSLLKEEHISRPENLFSQENIRLFYQYRVSTAITKDYLGSRLRDIQSSHRLFFVLAHPMCCI